MTAFTRVGAVAAATLVGMGSLFAATPAVAAETKVASLPANVTIGVGDVITLQVAAATVCTPGLSAVTASVPGKSKQNAVTWSGVVCDAGILKGSVVPNAASRKKNGVVKFTATNATTGEKVVATLVVHVTK